MPKANSNGIEIEYETFGAREASPLVLVMGLGAQMIFWDEAFCGMLADRGHYVVRFDNRDCGLSTKLEDRGVPDVQAAWAAAMEGKPVEAPYTVDDMADDTVGLLDALELETAHFVGASMGGMIVQTLGWRHRDRVKSLTSIMSTTGDPSLPTGTPEALAVLFRPPAKSKEEFTANSLESWKVIGGKGFPPDEARIRERSERSWDRCYTPTGIARQLVGVLAQGNRRPLLEKLDVPFLVIHGTDDPLVPQTGGEDTAAAVPGASLVLIEGMGHDLPRGAWPTLVDAISKHTEAAS
ncbi:MAG: alpha/beta hydrolase [Myxococcales bacterium]|nr:alpha/beta hydrolase [Myxococcales bacterium]